jgi:hypothetical protein
MAERFARHTTSRQQGLAAAQVGPVLPPLFSVLAAAGLPAANLARALAEARRAGVAFEEALYAQGDTTERDVARILSRRYGLSEISPHLEAERGTQLPEAAAAGLLRLTNGHFAVATRGPLFQRTLARIALAPMRKRVSFLPRTDLARLAMRADGKRVAAEAASGLARRMPGYAARTGAAPWQSGAAFLGAFLGPFLLVAAPSLLASALELAASLFFLALAWARIVACATPAAVPHPGPRLPDAELPVYTVLVPLHGERMTLRGLVAALAQLDYPGTKLDIKLLVEAGDAVTFEALRRLELPPWFEVVEVPPGGPATKPRALNVGLMTARGDFTVVYDAEDRPAPGQLRDALACFGASRGRTAVVQARLAIDGKQTGFIAEQFRLEYAGLFAVLLPALALFGLPMPLGGSSNHFRTSILCRIGAWDPANVTEDADIGIRLRRLGYVAQTIASATDEEAPATISSWLRQRTRWMKGWMVTALVHTRSPGDLVRDLGAGGAAVFLLFTAGVIASALLEPLCLVLVAGALLSGDFWSDSASLPGALLWSLFTTSLLVGHVAAAMVGVKGLARQGQKPRLRTFVLLPVYWLAISAAAWRAAWQMLRDPSKWEKTEHVLERMPPMDAIPSTRMGQRALPRPPSAVQIMSRRARA